MLMIYRSILFSMAEIEIVFMFGGQGNQYFGMARDLYFNQPVFRQYLDKCFGYIESRIGVRMNEIFV